MRHLKTYKLFESNASRTLVVVDVQPSYRDWFDARSFVPFIDRATDEYAEVVYFYNGEELGMESEMDMMQWLLDWGFEEDNLGSVNFVEKNYGWFRVCMDAGYRDDVAELVHWMYEHGKWSTRELTDEDWEALETLTEYMPEVREMALGDEVAIPKQVVNAIDNIRGEIHLMGGHVQECLGEIVIILDALNKDYEVLDEYTYG